MTRGSRARRLWWVLGVAVVVRVAYVALTPDYAPTGDASDYDALARSIGRGEGYPLEDSAAGPQAQAFRAPAYPVLLALVYNVTGDRLTAGRLFGVLLGVVCVALLVVLANDIWGRREALVAGWLGALYPPLVVVSTSILSETLFIAASLAAVIATLRFTREPGWRLALGAGALAGLAALTRPTGLLLLAVVVVTAALATRAGTARARAGTAALTVLAALLVMSPWIARNLDAFGRLVPTTTNGGHTLVQVYNERAARDGAGQAAPLRTVDVPGVRNLLRDPELNQAQIDSRLFRRGADFAFENPGYVIEVTRLNAGRLMGVTGDRTFVDQWENELGASPFFYDLMAIAACLLLAALIAAIVLARDRLRAAPWWLWLVPALFLLSTVPVLGNPRYRIAADPFALLAVAAWLAAVAATRARPAQARA